MFGLIGHSTSFEEARAKARTLGFEEFADGDLDVSGHDSGLLVVLGGVSSELKNLGCEVLKHCSKVDWGTSSNSFSVSA